MDIDGKRILITGGAGSFGSAFCLHLKQHNICPEKVIVMSRDVLKHNELKSKLGMTEFLFNTIICNVTDLKGLEYAFEGVDIVIHAAAIKHIVECEYNTRQTLAINCDGTQNVVDAAIKCGVKKTILISTDKACQAINTYGISKAMAEKIITNGNNLAGKRNSRFSVCRYGNVINSNGSIVPLFKRLIADGAKALPVTHPEMTRFFYKMNNAVKFVINSIQVMQGAETFIPKIPTAKIVSVAEAFDMPYEVIGIRPGEKLHECMIPAEMAYLAEDMGNHYMIKPSIIFRDDLRYPEGKKVPENFSYCSGTNPDFLTVEQIRELL